MITADTLSLVVINSANALLLGLSGMLAYDVLPGKRRVSILIHFYIMALWASAIIVVSVVYGDGIALVGRRWIGTAATVYVAILITLHVRRLRKVQRREVR
jgi:hypothetical protein